MGIGGGSVTPYGDGLARPHQDENSGSTTDTGAPATSFAGQPDSGTPGGASRPRPHRSLLRYGILSLIIGLLLLGGGAGWALRQSTLDRQLPDVNVTVAADSVTQTAAPDVATPSLIGLSEDEARQALADVGVAPGQVVVEHRPAAGEENHVVEQQPPAGRRVTGKARLVISAPANVPKLAGLSEAEARRQLEALGAGAEIVEAFAPNQPEGTVLSTMPAVGARLGEQLTLTVAKAPSSAFLSALNAVDSDCSTDTSATIDGQPFANSVTCSPSQGSAEPTSAEYVLSHKANRFEATFGQSDRGTTGLTVTFRVLVDDRVVSTSTAGLGQKVPVGVDVTGGLRLRIELTVSGGHPDDYGSASAVLGDARLLGAPDAITALVAESTEHS